MFAGPPGSCLQFPLYFQENFSSLDDYLCYIYVPVPYPHDSSDVNFPLSLDEEGTDVAEQTSTLGGTTQRSLLETQISSIKSTPEVFSVGNEIEPKSSEVKSPDRGNSSTSSSSPKVESLVVPFPDSAIRIPGNYRLVYFTKQSSDVLGISNAFSAVSNGDRTSYNLDWWHTDSTFWTDSEFIPWRDWECIP